MATLDGTARCTHACLTPDSDRHPGRCSTKLYAKPRAKRAALACELRNNKAWSLCGCNDDRWGGGDENEALVFLVLVLV